MRKCVYLLLLIICLSIQLSIYARKCGLSINYLYVCASICMSVGVFYKRYNLF